MIINRATSVYVIMLAILAGGLWVILAYGSTLIPAPDLAGKWDLTGPAGIEEMNLEQSGRFVHLTTPHWTADLKIISASSADGDAPIRMTGNGSTATFENLGLDDQCTLRLEGSITGVYQAHRSVRTYPKALPNGAIAATRPAKILH